MFLALIGSNVEQWTIEFGMLNRRREPKKIGGNIEQRATGNELLATSHGQQATGNGQRATSNGQWATGNGHRAPGASPVVPGPPTVTKCPAKSPGPDTRILKQIFIIIYNHMIKLSY